MNKQPEVPGTGNPTAPERQISRPVVLAALGISLVIYAALRPATIRAAWEEFERVVLLKSEPLPASPPRLSEHIIEELASLSPQKQAEMLVQRTVNHYEGAIELLAERVDGWRGQLQLTPEFNGLLMTAINSNDLRVRAAALEVFLAAYNVEKTEIAANKLMNRIQDEPDARPWALWMLGALGNRGMEPERVFTTLLDYVKDPSEETRVWAIEGLALLGSENTIRPLLDTFRSDPSMRVRERAACSLAQSGMLTKDLRMTAVPEMISMAEDPSVDAATRNWVYQALRDITGASVQNDSVAWRRWWDENGRR
jgi:HEAT repeat protein